MLSATLAATALVFLRPVLGQSLTITNNCNDKIWAHQYINGFESTKLYPIAAGASVTATVPGQPSSGDPNTAVNFYTGCTDDTAVTCQTGGVNNQFVNSDLLPFIRGEVAWTNGMADVYYNLSPLYGYNRALKINTDDGNCYDMQCTMDPANDGCPVVGPDNSCYAPCCSDAQSCAGTNSCPTDSANNLAHAGPGVHSDFYHTICPNAYSFPDDDQCARFHHSVVAECTTSNKVTMTLCPAGASTNHVLC